MKLTAIYSVFAIIATMANILGQDVAIRLYSGHFAVTLSMIVGTGVGLVVKYVLDKKYIFQYKSDTLSHDIKLFYLYTLMGVATTLIFWGFEFAFDHIFQTKEMRYLGGVIGLAIGYVVKYQLDKRYVFRRDL